VALLKTACVVQATNISASDQQALIQIEDKLFEHDYSAEDDVARLNRVEKFIFGSIQMGSLQDRFAQIQNALAVGKQEESEDNPVATAKTQQSIGQITQAPEAEEESSTPISSKKMFNYSTYPQVTQLEQELLGKTYVTEPIVNRLSRLEVKAFGQSSSDSDLSARTDRLTTYAERHDLYNEHQSSRNQQLFPSQQIIPMTDPSQFSAVGENTHPPVDWQATGVEPRIASMEQAVFGHTHTSTKKTLAERVQHLEKRLVPYEHNLAQKDLPTRVDNLWSIVSAANNLENAPLTASHANQSSNNIIAMNSTIGGVGSAVGSTGSVGSAQTNSADNTNQNKTHHSWLHNLSKAAVNSLMYTTPGPGSSTNFWLP